MAKRFVSLAHLIVERTYGGSHNGWLMEEKSRHVGAAADLQTPGESVMLTCDARGCGAHFTFKLFSKEERRRIFRRRFLRRLGVVVAAVCGWTLGAYMAFEPHPLAVRILGAVLFVPSLGVGIVTFLMLLFTWPQRYTLHHDPETQGQIKLPHNVRHKAVLS